MLRSTMRVRSAEQERLRAEAEARADAAAARLAQFRDALDEVSLGLVVVDPDGTEAYRNRRASAPTGDLQTDALVARAVAELLASGQTARRALELHGPPPRLVEIAVYRLAAGGAVAVIEDASERRRLDAVRKDFVDNVNHELRTPIGALGVLVDALQGETEPAVVKRLIDRMASEVERAQVLIEDLLALSRIEGQPERRRDLVPLGDVVAEAVDRVRPLSDRCGVSVASGRVDDVVVEGDREELVSAVANLLDNAVKYSESGSSVDVEVLAADGAADVVVRDRGEGIPARDLDRIFERFYRVDPARDRRTGGSGLGLAIVRHVAVNHGGEVLVQSVEGEGSTFTLRVRTSA